MKTPRSILMFALIALPALSLGQILTGTLLSPSSSPSAASVNYNVADLGAGSANAINKFGQVAGTITLGSGAQHAFFWSGGALTDIGALLGFGQSSAANGINDSGQVVGTFTDNAGTQHAFLWSSTGGFKDLGAFGISFTRANAINNSGVVVGEYVPSVAAGGDGYNSHAFVWNGSMQDLGTLGSYFGQSYSRAVAINDSGMIAGVSSTPDSNQHAVIFAGGGSILDVHKLANLCFGSSATGINNVSHITGTEVHANNVGFFYSGITNYLYLGSASPPTPPACFSVPWQYSYSNGINNSDQVVGRSDYLSANTHVAWFYSAGTVIDLNTAVPTASGWQLSSANAINDSGQIVGYGTLTGQQHAFLLTPTTKPPGAISVTTNLQSSTFAITGPGTFSGTGQSFVITNVPAGTYTISFNAVSGYATPASQIQTLTGGGTITFNATYTAVTIQQPAVNLGTPGASTNRNGSIAEPVNTATGNYYSTLTDLTVPGRGLSFVFTRNYNSQDTNSGPMGYAWTHSYNISLAVDGGTGVASIKQADGHQDFYNPGAGGSYTPQTRGLFNTLVKIGDNSFTHTFKNQTKYSFSPAGKLLTIADRNGNTQTLAYDGGGRLTSVTDPSGRAFTFTYDANGRLISLADPLARTLQYAYDASGNLISFRDAAGALTQYAYDASHRMTSAIDPQANTYLQNTYDAQGRVSTQKNARGFATTFAYNTPAANTTTITDSVGNVTKHVYDSGLRLIAVVDALGGTTNHNYDANNLKGSQVNPLGNSSAFVYDGVGNPTAATDSTGKTMNFTYDALNNPLTGTDALGRVTTFTYDAKGNMLTVTDAASGLATNSYDANGQILTTKNARGFTTTYQYDTYGNKTKITDPLNGTIDMTYDLAGRLLTTKNQLGKIWTRAYDANDRLVNETDPLGNATSYQYDANGNKTKVTDANGNATQYGYDVNNNLTQVADPLGGVTAYAYNGNDDQTGVTDANGHVTTRAYDSLRRLQTRTDPLSKQQKYAYDAAGNLTSTVDGKAKTNSYTYDALNRRVGASLSDSTSLAYTYDAVGNRLTMVDSRGTASYVYDSLNRVTSVTGPDAKVVTYAYDALGNRTSLKYPDAKTVLYEYDVLNRLTKATDWAAAITNYTYDAAGRVTNVANSNGTATANAYDGAGRLLSVVNRANGQVLSAFNYTLDRVGNRIELSSYNEGISVYGYDKLNRLTSWTMPSRQVVRYSYDAVGNRLSVSGPTGVSAYTYDGADEMLTAGTNTFTYDGNGSQKSKTAGGVTITYSWDALNRLAGVSGGGVNTLYQYDGDGNRVSQQVAAGTYAYSNDTVSALPVVLNESGPDGVINYSYGLSMIAAKGDTFQSFYQFDGLGSAASITDQSATAKAKYAYDPWGMVVGASDTLGTKNKYRFTGEAVDPGTGLVYLRARYYDPTIGRFISRDSIPVAANIDHSYQYALSNPIRFGDPSGSGPFTFFGKLFGFASWADSARQQRQDALNCVLNDPNCDIDAAQKTYYGLEQEAYKKAGDVALEGVDVAYGGTALSGGLNTGFESGTVLSYAKTAYDYYGTAKDVVGGVQALSGSNTGLPTVGSNTNGPNGSTSKKPRK